MPGAPRGTPGTVGETSAAKAGTVQTVVVDIDGTLLDSNYHHAVAWTRAFRAHGVDVPGWRVHRTLGMGGDRLVAAVAGDEVEERVGDDVRATWEKEYDALIEHTTLLPGARELLAACRERGLAVALASSAIPRHAQHALELLGAGELADGWTTAEDAEESKPDPELLDEALARVEGGAAVMVGDTVWDVEAAAGRDIPTIGLLSGGIGAEELRAAGAVAVHDDPRDLVRHLDEALRAAASATRR